MTNLSKIFLMSWLSARVSIFDNLFPAKSTSRIPENFSHWNRQIFHYRKRRIQLFSPALTRDLFSPARGRLENITHPYIRTSYNAISFILRTSFFDICHATNLYFSGKIQSNSHKIQAMKPGSRPYSSSFSFPLLQQSRIYFPRYLLKIFQDFCLVQLNRF